VCQGVVRAACSTGHGEPGAEGESWASWAASSPRSRAVPQHPSEARRAALVMVIGVGQQLCDPQANP